MLKQFLFLSALAMAAHGLVGGFTEQDPTQYIDKAWKSVPQINADNEGESYLVPIKVIKAQTKVVAGLKTELEVLVGESVCTKGGSEEINATNCPLKQGANRALYKVSIMQRMGVEKISARKIRDVTACENL